MVVSSSWDTTNTKPPENQNKTPLYSESVVLQSSIARRLGSPGCLPQSHHRNASLLKDSGMFPSFPADSKHLLPPERKSKPNCVQPHPSPACLQHQPSLCYLLTAEHPQAKTAPKSSPSCPSTGTWRVGLMTLTKAAAEIPVLLLKADVGECVDTQDRQQFIRITGRVTKGS